MLQHHLLSQIRLFQQRTNYLDDDMGRNAKALTAYSDLHKESAGNSIQVDQSRSSSVHLIKVSILWSYDQGVPPCLLILQSERDRVNFR